jgi:hypothetical protein
MIRQRFSTLLTTASLLLSLTAVSAAVPASTLGAIANVKVGGGIAPDTYVRAATPTKVSPGNVVGFYLWAKNKDAAGLSSFFLTASTDLTFLGAVWKHPGDATTNTCGSDVNGGLKCDFGALNSMDEILVLASYTVPKPASSSPDDCLPAKAPQNSGFNHGPEAASWVCVDFQFAASSGYVLEKGKNKSRGDAYHWYDFVATDVSSDQGAGFPFCDSNVSVCDSTNATLKVQNAETATGSDVQTTHLTAPPAAFNTAFDNSGLFSTSGLAVADNLGTFACPEGVPTCANHQVNGQNGFVGQWSQVDANSEQDFGTAFIRIELSMFGVKPQDIDGVMHIWQVALNVWDERPITALCPSAAGPAEGQNTECFWASGAGNVTTVLIWAHNNGVYRTF